MRFSFAPNFRHAVRLGTLALVALPGIAMAQGVSNPLRDAVMRSGGRVIVTLQSSQGGSALRQAGDPPVSASELSAISSRLSSRFQLRENSRAPFAGMVMGEISPDQATALAADPNVAAVEADRLWAPTDLGDGFDPSDRWAAYRRVDTTPYGVTNVTAPAVWATGNRGEGVKVAAMDSGGDATHPDLNYVGGYNAVTRVTSDWADDISVCSGHGTHVAGTIAALDNGSGVVGVAPRAQLYAIKVFENVGGSCLAYTSSQIAGLQWAVTQGIRLVNVSIGGTYSPSYDAAMQTAAAQGTYLIAASGNNGSAVLFPASSAYSIAVAAVDGSNVRASWSDFGPEVDFSAPGVGILSTMPGGGTGSKSGTSMATPHVVGVAALILSAFPSLSFAQLYQKLRDGALDLEGAGFDNNTGYGLVRAANSIGGVAPPPPPLTLAVSPSGRNASVVQGGSAASDQGTVTLSGTNSTTTSWTATKLKSWTSFTTGSGTGSGTVAWSRNAAGLAVGTYVDTISISASGATGSPGTIYDTLRVTAAPLPLTIAIAPTSRNVAVQQGGSAPSDQANVTLSGTNSSNTVWSATKRKSWTTLTTASGTGSGSVAWTRNASGLAVGTYVDTLTVSATGATGSPQILYDTLRVTSAPVPLTLAVSPSSRSATVQQGGNAPADQATVTLLGDNSLTTLWSATKRKSWTTLTTGSGTASGTLAWSRNATGLAVGTYVDTITVSAVGVLTTSVVYDTLRVTAAPVALTLAIAPTSRNVAVVAGGNAPSDQASITLAGDNSTATQWSATKRKSWTNLTNSSATGSGILSWSRNAAGLAAGTYVDTLTVSAIGVAQPVVLYDTLRVSAAPVPVTMVMTPSSRSTTVQVGGSASGDHSGVVLNGDNSATTSWTATKRKSWTTLTNTSGTGPGNLFWTRDATGLAAGVYVDTITVVAIGVAAPGYVYDTLRVTTAPVPLTLAVAPASRSVSVVQGTSAPVDQATITLAGDNNTTTVWSATKRKSWTTLTTATGTGSGTLAWSRNATGLATGTYVDTITVTAVGVATPSVVYDTLRITSAPVPVTLALSPAARTVSVTQGTAAAGDQATVTLAGTNAATTTWSATKRKSWTTLVSASGTGSGTVSWSRNVAALAVGTYVDTITVTAAGVVAPAMVFDTVRITSAPVTPITIAVSPGGRRNNITQGASTPTDSASVTLAGTGSATTSWSAARTANWTTLTTASGTGNGRVRWSRNTTALAVGTYVDTIRVVAGSVTAMVLDTVNVAAAPSTIAVTPKGKKFRVLTAAGSSASLAESTLDTAVVDGATVDGESSLWMASTTSSRFRLLTLTGELNGRLIWERLPANLQPGIHVDSIEIRLQRDPSIKSTFLDTLEVVAVPSPEPGIAVEELFRAGGLSEDQRTVFDRDGNRNGGYDLGDLLAWVERTHVRFSAEVASKLQGLMVKGAQPAVSADTRARRGR
ncbi:MAG: S8 family peptidase [Gemmatimonadales bacterium]